MTSARWKRRPPGSNWGDFGDDDQLGRLNLLTPAKVLEGIAEIREGRSFCLSLPLDYPGGNALNANRFAPVLRPTLRHGRVGYNVPFGEIEAGRTDVLSDDLVTLYLQYSTQWDGLAHVGSMFDVAGDGFPSAVYYNGYAAGVDVVGPADVGEAGAFRHGATTSTASAHALGIERMAEKAVQGRAVLVDLHAHFGDERVVVGRDALLETMRRDAVVVEPGDILCLQTGFADLVLAMGRSPDAERLHRSGCVLDGRDEGLLRWITDSGVAAIAADNYAVEAYPARSGGASCAALPLHEHCLFKLGIHLGELWHLGPLATYLRAHRRSRFFLTAPPLRLPGAIASPVTPVATV